MIVVNIVIILTSPAQLSDIGVSHGPQSQGSLSSLHVDFSRIIIGASLDRGAFGEVYRGSWNGDEVAVKVRTPILNYLIMSSFIFVHHQ